MVARNKSFSPQRETGISIRGILQLPIGQSLSCIAGHQGLDRMVQRVGVMATPDIREWIRADELLLMSAYVPASSREELQDLFETFVDEGLVAVALKLGQWATRVPESILELCNTHGLPLLLIPAELSFDEIITPVLSEVLNRQTSILTRSEEVHRVLLEVVLAGGSLEDVTRRAADLIDGAVIVTTADGRVLARGGTEAAIAQASEFLGQDDSGRIMVEEVQLGLVPEPMPQIVVPVVAGRLDHGRLFAIGTGRDLTQEDVRTMERAAMVAALTITQAQELNAIESKYQGDFVRDILTRRAGTPTDVLAHARSLGWDLERPFVVVVAEMDHDHQHLAAGHDGPSLRPAHERFAAAWQTVVSSQDKRAAVVSLSHEVVAFVGVPDEQRLAQQLKYLVGRVAGDGGGGRRSFCTGVSRVIHHVNALPDGYEQARTAVRVGRWLTGAGSVKHFDDLGIHRLLSLITETREVMAFVSDTLGPLAQVNDSDAADLRETLEVLLRNNLNVAGTARELHFHYNTLRYRIAKLESMVGPFTEDANLRLDISVALQAMRMQQES